MRENLAELWRFRELLRQMVVRELKVRYKNSAFGFLWSIVPPLLQVFVYSFLIRIMGVAARNYSAYLLCGLIPWTFINNAIMDSSLSLRNNESIIKKVYLPREIIPLAYVISNFIHFLLGWIVYFGYFFVVARFVGIGLPLLPTLALFPVITVMLLCFVTGVALFVSALNVFYDDVKFIVQTLFGLLFFLMPVIYIADKIYYHFAPGPQRSVLFRLYMINPIAGFIEAYRKTILQSSSESFNLPGPALGMDWGTFAGASVLSLFVLWAGYAYFNRRKWQFVERS